MVLQIARDPDAEKALVIVPLLTGGAIQRESASRDPASRLSEAVGLAKAIDLAVVETAVVRLARPNAASFLGKGKVQEFGSLIELREISLTIVDDALSPVQQRNLELSWGVKVLDRTGLILEIFGKRARTKEGKLQVELAHLIYQRSRLVRSWTHLGRQRGGFGFLGGPGETQIESDRRRLRERIGRLKAEIDEVRTQRRMHRARRRRDEYRSVALVGYTNAGKSTLFNQLAGTQVEASPMLFATLDPTVRSITLPQGSRAVLSDTVGFISHLPTMLVAAFRATLEEVTEADLIVHVRDISNPETNAQGEDVRTIIRQIDLNPDDGKRFIEVWNKIDVIELERRAAVYNLALRAGGGPDIFVVSARSGTGVDALRRGIEKGLMVDRRTIQVSLRPTRSDALAWLYENADVLERLQRADILQLKVRIASAAYDAFRRCFCIPENGTEEDVVKLAPEQGEVQHERGIPEDVGQHARHVSSDSSDS
jgi:GTPase